MVLKIVEEQLMSKSFCEFLNTLESNKNMQKEIIKKILEAFQHDSSHDSDNSPFELKDLQDIAKHIKQSLADSPCDERIRKNMDAELVQNRTDGPIEMQESNMFMGELMNEDEFESLEDGLLEFAEAEDEPQQTKLSEAYASIVYKQSGNFIFLPPCA